MRFVFNGLSPWNVYKCFRRKDANWKHWAIMWFSHFIYQSSYGTPFHPPGYYINSIIKHSLDATKEETTMTGFTNLNEPKALSPEELALLAMKPTFVTDDEGDEAEAPAAEQAPTLH